jgi:hypothetical protein
MQWLFQSSTNPVTAFYREPMELKVSRIMVFTTNPSAIKTQEATSSDAKITRGTLSRAVGRLNYRVSG